MSSSNDRQPGNRRSDSPSDSWDTCPTGVLTQMVSRLDASQRSASRKQFFRTAFLSTAVFACVVLSIGTIVGSSGVQYGGINCVFCRSHLAEYYPHAAGEVSLQDVTFVTSMETHLEKCSLCHEKFAEMYPDLPANNNASAEATIRPMLSIVMRPVFSIGQKSLSYR